MRFEAQHVHEWRSAGIIPPNDSRYTPGPDRAIVVLYCIHCAEIKLVKVS